VKLIDYRGYSARRQNKRGANMAARHQRTPAAALTATLARRFKPRQIVPTPDSIPTLLKWHFWKLEHLVCTNQMM